MAFLRTMFKGALALALMSTALGAAFGFNPPDLEPERRNVSLADLEKPGIAEQKCKTEIWRNGQYQGCMDPAGNLIAPRGSVVRRVGTGLLNVFDRGKPQAALLATAGAGILFLLVYGSHYGIRGLRKREPKPST